jgi:hypothetical protein
MVGQNAQAVSIEKANEVEPPARVKYCPTHGSGAWHLNQIALRDASRYWQPIQPTVREEE